MLSIDRNIGGLFKRSFFEIVRPEFLRAPDDATAGCVWVLPYLRKKVDNFLKNLF